MPSMRNRLQGDSLVNGHEKIWLLVDGGCNAEALTNQIAESTVPEESVKMKSETASPSD